MILLNHDSRIGVKVDIIWDVTDIFNDIERS